VRGVCPVARRAYAAQREARRRTGGAERARVCAQVFFLDTLKFFLSLYGHKLPVLSMDISSDGALLVSGSADKNIKIWGLDFGDCHKSLFAHQDSIMQARPCAHLSGLA